MMDQNRDHCEQMMRRLTIVRYLFLMGIEQSHKGEPFSAFSNLTLHDAAELFLQTALEHVGGALKKNQKEFSAYWAAIKEKTGSAPTLEGQMSRFNRARVALKHDGTLPAHNQIEEFRAIVTAFFDENSLTLFKLSFDEISLAGLVRSERIRTSLQGAEKALREGDCKTALEEAMKSFRLALSEYRRSSFGENLYEPTINTSWILRSTGGPAFSSSGSRFGYQLSRMVDAFGEALTVVAYNLDFDGYRYLRRYGPAVHELIGGELIVEWVVEATDNREIVLRCVTFAINAALQLQNKK
jgi:hypothetical protein